MKQPKSLSIVLPPDVAASLKQPAVSAVAVKSKTKRRDEPNGLETRFGVRLDHLKRIGVIVDYEYEPMTWRAIRTEVESGHADIRYTPDWVAYDADGRVTMFECKGFRREKDVIRFRAAAERWPCFAFFLVEWDKSAKTWRLTPYGGRATREAAKWRSLIWRRK